MNKPLPPIEDWKNYRSRIEYEDNLLNARVNVLLIVNGLGATAIGLTSVYGGRIFIATSIIIINFLLSLSTIQTAFIIRNLGTEYIREANDPIDERVRYSLRWFPRRLLPTVILGVWLPLVLLVSWAVGIVLIIYEN